MIMQLQSGCCWEMYLKEENVSNGSTRICI